MEIGGIMRCLAGDIGGTKTHLALYENEGEQTKCIKDQKFSSKKYSSLGEIVKVFLDGEKHEHEIERACFGIAGPVKKGKSQATNLPWFVDAKKLSTDLLIGKVALINDLEANAYGLKSLNKEELFILNQGDPEAEGNQAMVSAGTGLGEAGIFFDGTTHYPFACEGGHGDFGPRNELEDELLKYLRAKFQHVSYERILSGPGLYNIYRFFIDTKKETEKPDIFREIQEGDSPRLISEMGVKGKSTVCIRTLRLFSSIYGAEAGNMALKIFALGGVFLGGGIAPKILEIIRQGEFMESFRAKGRFANLLTSIPVKVVLNDNTALLGSIHYARNFL